MQLIGYGRTSTDDQSISLQVQREQIVRYCELYGHNLCDYYEEHASGKSMKGRPELQRALEAKADGIIVAKLDRLTRRLSDLIAMSESHGLVSVQEQLDTSNATGRFFLHILGSIAEWERGVISERTTSALSHKKKNGECVGGVPYGFALAGDGKTLIPDPVEQATVAHVLSLRNAGLSMRAIRDQIAMEGYKTRKGGHFSVSAVHAMVS